MEESAAASRVHARLHTPAPKRTMLIANFGFIILYSVIWRTVASYEYKNYPVQVHQMFQERLHRHMGSGDRVRGDWGNWAAWSDCSRSCGTGIQSQSRECVPMRGFRSRKRRRSIASIEGERAEVRPICIGTYRRYHVCNTQECPNFVDLRAEQCSKYNGKFHKGQSYQWEPFPDAPNECALNCRAIGERFYATLEPAVLDGTPCRGPGTHGGRHRLPGVLAPGVPPDRWLCVGGQCKSVGCDGVIGSGRVFDGCGICGGEGTGCRLFEGIFLEPKLPIGYQIVTTIPKGALSLNVSELRISKNLLALRNSNGSFFINGPDSKLTLSSLSGSYENFGTIFNYHRGDALHSENIWAEGPLSDPVDLMIFSEEINPGVLYKYMLPVNEKFDDSAMLAPPLLVAGPNDKIGNEIPEDNNNLTVKKKINDRRDADIKIPIIISSNKEEKEEEYEDSDDPNRYYNQTVNGTQKMAGDQPIEISSSSVSSSSSSLIQSNDDVKTGIDLRKGDDDDDKIKGKGAGELRASKKRKKNIKNRKKFYWKISSLSPCSKACGGGLQYATFKCFRESTQAMAPERRCKNVVRPPSPPPLTCNARPCPPRWHPGAWGPCSVSCGLGIQTRELECVQELNSKLKMRVASGACIEKSDIKTTGQCKKPPCISSNTEENFQHGNIYINEARKNSTEESSRWTAGPWESCSNTCGSGIRKRDVTCVTRGDTKCSSETKPINESPCESLPECGNIEKLPEIKKAPWLYTDWSSECSADCGSGFLTRQIACQDGNELFCDVNDKPKFKKTCYGNDTKCGERKLPPQWFVGGWSSCTVSCGTGIKKRDVICVEYNRFDNETRMKITKDNDCDISTRPIAEEKCSQSPCPPEWFTSDWSECSHSCGPGLQTRVVRCLSEGLPDPKGCSASTEPKTRRLCKIETCKSELQSPTKTPKKFNENTECVDKYPNCEAVLKAGLCRINYYKHSCCSCRDM